MKDKQLQIKFQEFTFSYLSSKEKELFQKAADIRLKAYAPYSHFAVGCAVMLENGEILTANNQENAAYPSGLCAERAAIFFIGANYPEYNIKKIFIVGGSLESNTTQAPVPPCGACRQSLLEYEQKQKKDIKIYFSDIEGNGYLVSSVKDLVPFSFGAEFL